MSIYVNKDTKVLVQGITGGAGSFHAKQMLEYGTRIVGGVTPGKGGMRFEDKVPVYDTVAQAKEATGWHGQVVPGPLREIRTTTPSGHEHVSRPPGLPAPPQPHRRVDFFFPLGIAA